MKLSLAIIAKDNLKDLDRIIGRYEKYFDVIDIALDDKEAYDVLRKIDFNGKINVYLYEWSEEEKKKGYLFFDRKRNFLHDKVQADYYFRLDTDDDIVKPELIREVFEDAVKENTDIVYCWYDYSRDEFGNCHAAHYRETIIKKSPHLFWNKRIHENVIPKFGYQRRIKIDDRVKILHNIDNTHAEKSLARNLKYLIDEYQEDKENTDPRTLAYLGRMFHGLGKFKEAQYFLERHIEKSGWDEDRYMSWCSLADIMLLQKKYKDAIGCCFEAVAELPDRPDAYFKLHEIYFELKQYDKSVYWGKIGFKQKIPKTFMLLDPSSYTWRPAITMAFALYQVGEIEAGYEFFKVAEKCVPTLDFIKQNKKLFEQAVKEKRFTEKFINLFNEIVALDKSKAKHLVEAIPYEFLRNDLLSSIYQSFAEPKVWGEKSIVIYCGNTPHEWYDGSVEQGIGGSEEAVIYASRELVKLGYFVTVFCNCGDNEGIYNGVEYKNATRFNPKDIYNILIGWRGNIFQVTDIKAKLKILWLHDYPQPDQFPEGKLGFDKVFVLSQYHKSLLPKHVPDDKIFVTTNGINEKDFIGLDEIEREPYRVIYASSYDRGLEHLLNIWGDVKKEVPEAELHIFYGWNTFDEYVRLGLRDGSFKERMVRKMQQAGVYEHGRVGHKQLLKEYAKSRVFAYPTNFQGEINCIALTKAVACGCVPVTNNKYVLGERNPYDYLAVDDKNFKKTLIDVLRNKIDVAKLGYYIKDNSWKKVVKDWNDKIFSQLKEKELCVV